jgi:hypothetical protein
LAYLQPDDDDEMQIAAAVAAAVASLLLLVGQQASTLHDPAAHVQLLQLLVTELIQETKTWQKILKLAACCLSPVLMQISQTQADPTRLPASAAAAAANSSKCHHHHHL